MKRRRFLGIAAVAGISAGSFPSNARPGESQAPSPAEAAQLPDVLGGMSLEQLREDCRRRLFQEYLPFWEKGGYDQQHGGFLCELRDDGSVAADEKFLWYQGRALWVYAFLYRHFGKDRHWLEIAAKTRDFLVNRMYAGGGKWLEKVHCDGTLLEGVGGTAYGWLFAAGGLAQYYLAVGNLKDLELALASLGSAVKRYDDPAYADTYGAQYAAVAVPREGLRSQGHSMLLVWTLSQLLETGGNAHLAELQQRHVNLLTSRFWNADYGIVNEFLQHDYSRIPGAETHMYAGHSLESSWIVLYEALRTGNRALFDVAAVRVRHLLELCWDYVFEGCAGGDFFVFGDSKHAQGPDYTVKTMWAQCEILIACLTVWEYTGQAWAKEWYDRTRTFVLKSMPVAAHGVWRQAVDRRGHDVQRAGISKDRKDNFHQARMLMLNLLSLDRLIADRGRITPFPR